jgi:glycerophosphoryl diester phosphodiesterase
MLPPLKDFPFDSRIMICAHRGDTSHGAAENSLDSIDEALKSGAEMIEVDVQMTRDGIFVCHHDEKLSEEQTVWQTNYDDLLRHDDKNHLPSFESILEKTAGICYLNIEMKEYSAREPKLFTDALVALVRKYGMHEYSLYSSFRIDYLWALPWDAISTVIHPTSDYLTFFNSRSAKPVIPPKPLEEMLPSELLGFSRATTYACMLSELGENALRDIRQRNIHLSIYTISNTADFEKAKSAGAKAVVTDIAAELVRFRG